MGDNKCFEARENILKLQEEMLNIKSFENEMKQKEKEAFLKKSIEDSTEKVSYISNNI
jgi:hypothetical protein